MSDPFGWLMLLAALGALLAFGVLIAWMITRRPRSGESARGFDVEPPQASEVPPPER